MDNDDVAAVYLAVKEVTAAPSTSIKDLIGVGIIPFRR